MTLTERGFTLLELLTVIAMIGLIAGALTTSMAAAQERARIQKAQADVKSVTQAVLGYENLAKGHLLKPMEDELSKQTFSEIFSAGAESEYGTEIPVMLQASLDAGGTMRDPWGTAYRIRIKKGQVKVTPDGTASGAMSTGFSVPNLYRLSKEERR